jgi:hypothetical protein
MGPAVWQEVVLVGLVLAGGVAGWPAWQRSKALGALVYGLTALVVMLLARRWGVDVSGGL